MGPTRFELATPCYLLPLGVLSATCDFVLLLAQKGSKRQVLFPKPKVFSFPEGFLYGEPTPANDAKRPSTQASIHLEKKGLTRLSYRPDLFFLMEQVNLYAYSKSQ